MTNKSFRTGFIVPISCAIIAWAWTAAAGMPFYAFPWRPGEGLAYTPISGFKTATRKIELPLIRPVYNYLQGTNRPVYVVGRLHSDSTIHFRPPAAIDTVSDPDTVFFRVDLVDLALVADFVLAGTGFIHEAPVVTHWKKNHFGIRGFQEIGATDPVHNPENGGSRLHYNTAINELFTDAPNDTLPGFEQYVGEKYTYLAINQDTAAGICATIAARTGFPAILKNCEEHTTVSDHVQEDLPAFQVLYGIIFEVEPGHASLATIVLPPRWRPNPSKRYPIIFTSHYDLNTKVYATYNLVNTSAWVSRIMNSRGPNDPDGAIQIYWNGGGSAATYTTHGSAFRNAELLFQTAHDVLGADQQEIVGWGVSRGGIAGVALAGRQSPQTYRFRYVASAVPPFKIGDQLWRMDPYSCPSMGNVYAYVTGDKRSWRPEWISRDGLSGKEQCVHNLLGLDVSGLQTEDMKRDRANDSTVFASQFMQRVKDGGTELFFSVGAADAFKLFYPHLEYVEAAGALGIPVSQDIGYFGTGHGFFPRLDSIVEVMLRSVCLASDPPFDHSGTRHFWQPTPQDASSAVEFDPFGETGLGRLPFFVETPIIIEQGFEATMNIVGPGGTHAKLTIQKINDSALVNHNEVLPESPRKRSVLEGLLPEVEHSELSYIYRKATVGTHLTTGYYAYELSYREDPGDPYTVVETLTSDPGITNKPVLKIVAAGAHSDRNTNQIASLIGVGVGGDLGTNGKRNISWGLFEWPFQTPLP